MSVGLWLGTFLGDIFGSLVVGDLWFRVFLYWEPRFRQASILIVLLSGGIFLVQEWHSAEVPALGGFL